MSKFINLGEFAAKLGVSTVTASKKLKNHEYPAFVRGKKYKIPESAFLYKDIEEFESEHFPDGRKFATTIMIGNHKGGSGKTTGIVNIAASLAFLGKKVLIVDMDNQANASTINKLHIEKNFDKRNITRLLLEMKGMDEEELRKKLKKTIVNVESEHFFKGSLDLLPNSLEWDEKKEQLFTYPNAENMLNRLLRHIKEDYDYILIDTHPSMDVVWRMSVMASDSIIIGNLAEQYSIEGLAGIFKRIYALNEDYKEIKGRDIEVLGGIISAYREKTNIAKINAPIVQNSIEKYCLYNKTALLEPFISHSVHAAEQQSLGGPIMFNEASSQMCAEYIDLTVNIVYGLYKLEIERGN